MVFLFWNMCNSWQTSNSQLAQMHIIIQTYILVRSKCIKGIVLGVYMPRGSRDNRWWNHMIIDRVKNELEITWYSTKMCSLAIFAVNQKYERQNTWNQFFNSSNLKFSVNQIPWFDSKSCFFKFIKTWTEIKLVDLMDSHYPIRFMISRLYDVLKIRNVTKCILTLSQNIYL